MGAACANVLFNVRADEGGEKWLASCVQLQTISVTPAPRYSPKAHLLAASLGNASRYAEHFQAFFLRPGNAMPVLIHGADWMECKESLV